MINSVSKLIPSTSINTVSQIQGTDAKASGTSFSDVLSSAIAQVNDSQVQAEQMTELLATGKAPDLHSVMIASEKATLSFQLAVQVRNKAMDAYQEIMRMQM